LSVVVQTFSLHVPVESLHSKIARVKKAIPGKDGFVGLREDCISGLWVRRISTWGKNGQK